MKFVMCTFEHERYHIFLVYKHIGKAATVVLRSLPGEARPRENERRRAVTLPKL